MVTVMGGKLRPVILSKKYFRKFSHKMKDGTIQSESLGLTRELKTLKRIWGRCLLLATTSEFFLVLADFTALSFFHSLSATLQAHLRERVVSFNQGSDKTLGWFSSMEQQSPISQCKYSQIRLAGLEFNMFHI